MFQGCADQTGYFARGGVASCLQFGIDQAVIEKHLEPAAIRRDEHHFSQVRFVFLKQFLHQADSPVGVVSDLAVGDPDGVHHLAS